jgi:hypothetical protein
MCPHPFFPSQTLTQTLTQSHNEHHVYSAYFCFLGCPCDAIDPEGLCDVQGQQRRQAIAPSNLCFLRSHDYYVFFLNPSFDFSLRSQKTREAWVRRKRKQQEGIEQGANRNKIKTLLFRMTVGKS